MRKRTRSVLDTFALLAFLFRERGFEEVGALLEWAVDHEETHLTSAVNWAEVRYMIERKMGTAKWLEVRDACARLPIEIVPARKKQVEQAAIFKVQGGMSLADCFAAALAKSEKLPLYTGDPEF